MAAQQQNPNPFLIPTPVPPPNDPSTNTMGSNDFRQQGIHRPSDNTPSDGEHLLTEIHPARALGCVRHGLDKQCYLTT